MIRKRSNGSGSVSDPLTIGQIDVTTLNVAGLLTSSIAAGSNAIKFTNAGARLCLGNDARYFTDDGTNLAVTGPLAVSGLLSSSVASGSNAIKLTSGARLSLGSDSRYFSDNGASLAATGNFVPSANITYELGSSSLGWGAAYVHGVIMTGGNVYASGNNVRLSYRSNVTDGASAIAHRFGHGTGLSTGGAKIVAFYSDDMTTERASIDLFGTYRGNSVIATNTVEAQTRVATPLFIDLVGGTRIATAATSQNEYTGRIADGASAIAHKFGNSNSLTTSGAKIAAFYSDGMSTEKLSVSKDGKLAFDYTNNSSGDTVVTINKPTGQIIIPPNEMVIRVDNSCVTTSSKVFLQILSHDATLTTVISEANNGYFYITGNNLADDSVPVDFLVIN